jgi:hypothetical protein
LIRDVFGLTMVNKTINEIGSEIKMNLGYNSEGAFGKIEDY